MVDVLARNNVSVAGRGRAMFAHGSAATSTMWRLVTPAFADEYRIGLYDQVGAGGSDLSAFHPARYGSLHGYARDVLEICGALDLRDVVFVGHSVSAMVGVLAAIEQPARFSCSCSWARRRATSTTRVTPAGSAGPTSRNCSTRSTATTLDGRAP